MYQKVLDSLGYIWEAAKKGLVEEANARYWNTMRIPNKKVHTMNRGMYRKVRGFSTSR